MEFAIPDSSPSLRDPSGQSHDLHRRAKRSERSLATSCCCSASFAGSYTGPAYEIVPPSLRVDLPTLGNIQNSPPRPRKMLMVQPILDSSSIENEVLLR